MSSIPGLPTQGSDVNVLITRVHLHPLCVLVEFWGKFQERTEEYERLAKDIQSPGNPFQNLDGKPGDQCLVRIDGTWYRARVVSRSGPKYSVFLIDKGIPFSPTISGLSWGKKEHFLLPPEVEFCVLANVLPVSPENKWSPVAHEFLKSLSGKSLKAHVQDVLVPNRTFLLHIPCISTQMYEMGFAKKLSQEKFHDFVLTSMQCHSGVAVSPEPQPLAVTSSERLHKQVMLMYPELPGGTVETVIVTEVSNPQRIFCQLKVFSQELKKLSEQLSQSCEGRMSNCIITSDMIGYPCATRGTDGRWYRSVLQQVLQANKLVEVLNVDFGTKQIVQVKDVRPLAAEFFRMPVVTYICSLHGVFDKGVGWTTHEIEYLRSLLLFKTVIGKFEYQSISEGVHYITLYGDDNTNINNLFGSKDSSLLECEKTLGDYALRSVGTGRQHLTLHGRKMPPPGQVVEEKAQKTLADELPAEDLPLHSSVKAVVQHVCNPSEFWIQTQKHGEEFSKMMDSIYNLYKDSQSKNSVTNPTVGLYCAAKAEDGDFYRATVTEVNENQLKVFFVDYGNTEVVDNRNIRTLPAECQTLPRLALKCSLNGVQPKDGVWTQSASEFFIKAVTDKVLEVNVMGKCDDSYVVQLTDPELKGQKNLGKLMCIRDFAEYAELQRQSKDGMAMQTAITIPTQHNKDARVSGLGVCGNSEISIRTQKPVFSTTNERKVALYKECMFPIGSVLDVNVSYIENPNDFWCQLARNAGHLKLLMHDMQAHYEGSKFDPNVETACVARNPDNGMWYRALVIHKHGTPHVNVLFVDYGQTETVSLYDVRRIEPEFLTLHGQAFRCSLLNLSDPMSAMTQWNEKAVAKFQDFVHTAASNFVILKCTIYAVMYSEQRIVFNIVDLETPFESVCTSMVNLVQEAPPKKSPGPLLCLNTYYYSTHGVKTGTEEQVTVTCVENINQFYCQLEKNTDVLTDLQLKVNSLCKQLQNAKLPAVIGTMCFARYTDKQWYRGQIKATLPALLVHFVDYGDTIEVARLDLLPVPKEASDIMSVPVQAIMCGLSDIPGNVPSDANSWFETKATECNFRALVVAREPDGKLLVELYCRNEQINAKIKKMFHIKMHTEEKVVLQSRRAFETPKCATALPTNMGDHTQPPKNSSNAIKPNKVRDEWKFKDKNDQSSSKSSRQSCDNDQKFKSQVYKPPGQRLTCGDMPNNDSKLATKQMEPRKEHLDTDATLLTRSKSLAKESQEKNPTEKLPRLSDLPLKSITSGMTADIYVSQCDNPLSFYVHFVKEEDELFSLGENLNDPEATAKTCPITDVHPGDLVQAEFADDSSLYRAVVKECQEDQMVLVKFVDFGNTARIPVSKLSTLHKSFLHLPIYSTHCMLSDATNFEKETVLDPEVVSAFKEAVESSEDKVLKCQFIRLTGSVWEVSLEDNGVNVTCKVSTQCSEIPEEELDPTEIGKSSDNKLTQENMKESLLQYDQQQFFQDEKLEVYISIIIDAQTFWCQSAHSEELEKITSSVAEVGNFSDHQCISQAALKPGSPCIALFSDDHFWYRAEVINKDGDKLKVLFVDYGNESQVSISDVREMPPLLVEIPPQAFLCELEGFDSACGSWDSSAADKLSGLTVDKMLEMTVIKGKTAGQKTKWVVQVECEDQVINETMKGWWKSFSPGDKLCLLSSEVPPEHNSTVIELSIPQTQFDQDVDPSDESAHLEIVHNDERGSVELANPCTADNVSKLANGSKDMEWPEESVLVEASVVTQKEESVATELVEMVPAMAELSKEISPPDIVTDETMLLLLDDEDNQDDLTSASNENVENEMHTERGQPSIEDTVGTEDFSSSVDENLKEDVDESESPTKEAPPEEFLIFSDPEAVEAAARTTRTCSSAAKMVLCEIVSSRKRVDQREGTDTILGISQKIQTELALPSVVLPKEHLFDVPIERESEAGNVTQEEEPLVEIDSLREGEASAQHVDTHSDDALVATEPHSDPVHCTVTAEMFEEWMCLVEENQSAVICTGSKESRGDSDVTNEETPIHSTVPLVEVLDLRPRLAEAATEPHCDPVPPAQTDEKVEESHSTGDQHESLSSDTAEEMVPGEDVQPVLGDSVDVRQRSLTSSRVASDAAGEMFIHFIEEVLDLQTPLPGPEVAGARGERPSCDAADETSISFTVPQKKFDFTLPHNVCTTHAEEPTEVQSEVPEALSEDTVEAKVEDEEGTRVEAHLLTVKEEHPALRSVTEPQTCTSQFPDLSNLLQEVTCLVGDLCLGDVCREPLTEAGTVAEDTEPQEATPPQQDKDDDDDSVLTERLSPADHSFESQTSSQTCLTPVGCVDSADMLPEQQPEE